MNVTGRSVRASSGRAYCEGMSTSSLDRTAVPGAEIERKFLLIERPEELKQCTPEHIAQGYLALDPEGAEVRLRRRGYHTLLTIKQGRGLARAEEEFLIDGPRFERLWAGTSGRRVEKARYRLPLAGDLVAEIDIYEGSLAGLMVAEVEFPSVEAAEAFEPPLWLRVDVTDDPRYGNARLALDGIPDRRHVGEHGLLDGEPVADGVRHVALAQLAAAADALQGRDAKEYGKAVHTARKAFKRGRALVRIAKDGLGEEVAERDNAALREAGRRLAGARDAQVVLETLGALERRFPETVGAGQAAELRVALADDFTAADRAARSDAGAVDEVLEILEATRHAIATWDLGAEPAEVLAAGLERIHHRGRKALKVVKHADDASRTEDLHGLRKRAKDLWHAAELLEVAAPKRMRQLATDAHALADLIGDDHDLAVLADRARALPEAFAADADAAAFAEAIEARRRKLQRKALKLAGEIYGHRPASLVERVRELGPR